LTGNFQSIPRKLDKGFQLVTEQEQKLANYITRTILRRKNVPIDADTPLVSSGLIDSIELIDVLTEVENVTHTRIPAGKVKPQDMDTIGLMLETATRLGRPR
jgi:hypothetical protein